MYNFPSLYNKFQPQLIPQLKDETVVNILRVSFHTKAHIRICMFCFFFLVHSRVAFEAFV